MFDWPLRERLVTMATFGYCLGCVNCGYYLVRLRRRVDLRAVHSGNAGATNAGRVLGRRAFVAVLALDTAKGASAALVGLWVADYAGAATAALACIAGHIWPAQLSFRGGKGIAAALGGLFVLEPAVTASAAGLALLLHAITRRWSASGLVAVGVAPLLTWPLGRPLAAAIPIAIAAAAVLFAHRRRPPTGHPSSRA